MPASSTAPVPGVDYGPVPTTRLAPEIPLPAVSAVQPTPATRWVVTQERHAYDSAVRRTVVHRADCWQAAQERGAVALDSEAEARAAMQARGARGCSSCGTDQSLS